MYVASMLIGIFLGFLAFLGFCFFVPPNIAWMGGATVTILTIAIINKMIRVGDWS